MYALPSISEYATFDLNWEVMDDLVLDVPAGSFHAYGVAQTFSVVAQALVPGRVLALDRRIVAGSGKARVTEATDWCVEGVEVMQ